MNPDAAPPVPPLWNMLADEPNLPVYHRVSGVRMSEEPIRSMYQERPDYRVDPLVRTNAMSAWHGDIRLAHSDACPIVDEQDHGPIGFDQDEGRVTIGAGRYTGGRS